MGKGDYEEGVVIKGFLNRKTYVIKEIMIGGAKLEDRETGAEINISTSALKLFFEFAEERRGIMGSLSEQLLKAGLVSKEKHETIEKEKEEHDRQKSGELIHQASKKSGRPVGLVRLESCGTVAEFKDTARKLLQEFPEEITEVINLAHRFKDAPGGKKIIWLVYQVKDGLAKVKPTKREQFLKRAFRKAGTDVETPEDWLK